VWYGMAASTTMRWAALGAAAAGAFGAVWLLRRRRLADEARARRSFAEPRAPRELVLAEKPARSWSCALLEVDVAHTPPLRATCLLAAALESASRELVVLVVADWRSWDGRGLSDYLIQWYTLLDALQSRGHRVDASVVLATPAEREATLTRLLLYPDLEVAFNCAAAPVTRANARRAELFLPRDLVASPLAETPSELAEELSARFPREPPAVLEGTRDRVRSAIIGGTFDHLHAGHKLLISVAAYLAEQKLGIGLSGERTLALSLGPCPSLAPLPGHTRSRMLARSLARSLAHSLTPRSSARAAAEQKGQGHAAIIYGARERAATLCGSHSRRT
jgi:hypothetical protein